MNYDNHNIELCNNSEPSENYEYCDFCEYFVTSADDRIIHIDESNKKYCYHRMCYHAMVEMN